MLRVHAGGRDGEPPSHAQLPERSALRHWNAPRARRFTPEMKPKSALDWLLEEDQPTVRYLTLTRLLGRPLDDPVVVAARDMMTRKGGAEKNLTKEDHAERWVSGESLYHPKYLSTNWMLLVLADLGVSKADPRIEKACELWIDRCSRD